MSVPSSNIPTTQRVANISNDHLLPKNHQNQDKKMESGREKQVSKRPVTCVTLNHTLGFLLHQLGTARVTNTDMLNAVAKLIAAAKHSAAMWSNAENSRSSVSRSAARSDMCDCTVYGILWKMQSLFLPKNFSWWYKGNSVPFGRTPCWSGCCNHFCNYLAHAAKNKLMTRLMKVSSFKNYLSTTIM